MKAMCTIIKLQAITCSKLHRCAAYFIKSPRCFETFEHSTFCKVESKLLHFICLKNKIPLSRLQHHQRFNGVWSRSCISTVHEQGEITHQVRGVLSLGNPSTIPRMSHPFVGIQEDAIGTMKHSLLPQLGVSEVVELLFRLRCRIRLKVLRREMRHLLVKNEQRASQNTCLFRKESSTFNPSCVTDRCHVNFLR